MRPGKLRLVVLMHTSDALRRPKVSEGPPRHAPQPLGPILHPASARMSYTFFSLGPFSTPRRFSLNISECPSVDPGTQNVSTFTCRPLRMLAAKIMSVIFPPVHEPIYARSSFT